MWGWDGKIHLEDHRLASRGLHEFLAHELVLHFILETYKNTSRKSWKRWDATWWRHFNITMTSGIDVLQACDRRAAVCILYFPRAGTGMWDRIKTMEIPIWCARIIFLKYDNSTCHSHCQFSPSWIEFGLSLKTIDIFVNRKKFRLYWYPCFHIFTFEIKFVQNCLRV